MVQDTFSTSAPSCTAEDLSINSVTCLETAFCLVCPAYWEDPWGTVWESDKEHTNNKENG